MPRLIAWSVGILLLPVTYWLGSWPAALLWALAFVLLARREGPTTALAAAAPAIFWLLLLHWSGDRRLFFPYAVQVGQASSPVPILAAFFAIRIQQSATPHVLLVEFLVTAVVLLAGALIQRRGPPGLSTRILASAVAAALALLGLLL